MKTLNLLLTIPIVLCIIMNLAINESYLYLQNELYQCKMLTTELSIKQLSLRRHEKDFFFRKQQKYLDKWKEQIIDLKRDFQTIKPCFDDSLQVTVIAGSTSELNNYEASFLVLASELHNSDKQSLSMLNSLMSQQELLEKRAEIEDINIYAQTLGIRQHLFEYITSEQAISLQLLSNNVAALSQWANLSHELQTALNLYIKQLNTLQQFVESHQYSHEAGTMGKMRSSIHKIEALLPQLMDYLDSKIELNQSLRVFMYFLILLLIYITYRLTIRKRHSR